MVEIYTTNSCPSCKVAKSFMAQNKVKYVEKNVEENDHFATEMMNATGASIVPQFKLGEEYVVGFNPKAIQDFVKK